MAARKPVFTENFSAALAGIETFVGAEGEASFARFFNCFVADIVPMLCRFPHSGRSFLERSLGSAQTLQLAEKLTKHLGEGDDVRELIVDDYLILYLLRRNLIVFLSIKHHRQLSFDLKGFWLD